MVFFIVQTWPQYQEWGDESLDRIVDPVSRRAIELRFVLTILSVDPEAYPVRVFLHFHNRPHVRRLTPLAVTSSNLSNPGYACDPPFSFRDLAQPRLVREGVAGDNG